MTGSVGGTTRGRGAGGAGAEPDHSWGEHPEPSRDWKKLVLVIGLGALSWVATYVGMLELIESNMGDLPIVHKAIIGFSVAMLMTMIIWLLDQIFAPTGILTKLVYIGGYIFLTIISVGFGFGFYWKVLESRSETTRSAESAVAQVQGSLHGASTRLEQLQATLVQLTEVSTQKAQQERAQGTSCPNSRPGDGPRRKLRDDDAARFSFASDFVKGRIGTIKGDVTALNAEMAKIASEAKSTINVADGTRNDYMRALSRKLDMTVTGFNAFRTDPQLKQIRADLSERADKTVFPDTKGGTFACPDPQLQTALRGVVRAIDQLPELEKPKVAAVEGSEATIEAFRRLTATFYGALSFKMPPSAEELRSLQQKAVQSVENSAVAAKLAAAGETVGLSRRDYIPLAIAIFVDLCLLLVSMGRPVHNRLHNLVPKMKAAERGPVYQILSKFTDIHKDEATRETFEIFRHVVFDYSGDFYVAVPLDAPKRANPDVRLKLQQEAHLLANLFASFEKEKIFKRSMLPTNATIRRKLERQGSKFAGADSFRVYRFRDGAWSDIILGAVMGASKRAETVRRRLKVEAGPELPMPVETSTSARAMAAGHEASVTLAPETLAAARGQADPRASFPLVPPAAARRSGDAAASGLSAPATRSAYRSRPAAPVQPVQPARAAAPPLDAQFGAYATGAAVELGTAYAAGPGAAGEPRRAPSHDYRRTAAAFQNVERARHAVGEAHVDVVAADNSNTAPGARAIAAPGEEMPRIVRAATAASAQVAPAMPEGESADLPENVIAMPQPKPVPAPEAAALPASTPMPEESIAGRHDRVTHTVDGDLTMSLASHGDGIEVTASRETVTFTLPASEGRLSPALRALARRAVSLDAAEHDAISDDSGAPPAQVAAAADGRAPILLPPPAEDAGTASTEAIAAALLEVAEGANGAANGHASDLNGPGGLGEPARHRSLN